MPATQTDRLLGLSTSLAVKPPCVVAATSNITLSGLQTISSVAVVAGNRVLATAQTDGTENLIWIASAGAWTLAKDSDGARDLTTGTLVLTAPGTGQAQMWELTTAGAIVPGTTSLTWQQHTPEELALRTDLASTSDAAKGGALSGFSGTLAYALNTVGGILRYFFGRTAQEISAGVTPSNYGYAPGDVRRYGAVGDNVTDDLTAFNSALSATPDGGVVSMGTLTYRLSAVWTFPNTRIRITVEGNGALIRADHTGHGIDLTAQNEAYGGHILRNFVVYGPNVSYPMSAGELAGTSTGAGIKIGSSADTSNAAAGYNTVLFNVEARNFYQGLYMRAGMLGKYFGLRARYNQVGVYVDGGQANSNDFFGCTIRENRVAGVYSSGATGGSLTNSTQNRFWGGTIETNIPYRGDNPAGYSGGYRTARDLLLAENGIGVVLLNSYDWSFHDTYFENQNWDVWLGSSSDSCNFNTTRFGNGGSGRCGGVMFSGAGVVNNKFSNVTQIGSNATDVTVKSDHADHAANQFLDTEGFNFIAAELTGRPHVRNNMLNQAGGGTRYGCTLLPTYALTTDSSEGTTPGNIDGIGTATAALNVTGMEEISFGAQVAASGSNTTIDEFVGGRAGQRIVLIQNQTTRTVTIKAGTLIIPQGAVDGVFATTTKRQIVFRFNAREEAIEEGRNF